MLKTILKPRKFDNDQWVKLITQRPKTILSANSKLYKDGIVNFTLPAYKALVVVNGKLREFKTCQNAGQCLNWCYASAGAYSFDNSMIKHHRNLQFLISDPFEFVEQFVKEINSKKKLKFVRFHDSGDMVPEFWPVYKTIMERCPHIKFYAYSKMVSFFKSLYNEKQVPSNFSVVYSEGGTQDKLINTKVDRHSRVFKNRKTLRAFKYVEAYKSDLPAANPKNTKIGLIIHGSAVSMNIIRKNKFFNITQ